LSKNILVIADLHTGHRSGLTPPSRHARLAKTATQTQKDFEKIRQDYWRIFAKEVKKLGKIDILLANGDLVDGEGWRSGKTEIILNDMQDQCDAAAEILKFCQAREVHITCGTPYHTGVNTDWERYIAHQVRQSKYTERVELHDRLHFSVNGCVINMLHKIGSSSVPYGRNTSLSKSRTWNELRALRQKEELANIYIRSHAHYYKQEGDHRYTAMITPSLQGESIYGNRQCDHGDVDWGIINIRIEDDGGYTWHPIIPEEANRVARKKLVRALP